MRPRWMEWLARAILRGPDAPYIIADLEESYTRDLNQGRSAGAARRRYLTNALTSALRLTATGRAFGLGASWLDVKLGVRMLLKQPALTIVAVFALGRRWLGAGPGALVAAFVFALHPLQIETVPVAARRADMLFTLFLLGALFVQPLGERASPRALAWGAILFGAIDMLRGLAGASS